MEQQTFADGIGRIAIIDGIVRLDLVANSPTETGADGKPHAVFAHRVIMGVDQFLRASEKIAEAVKMIRDAAARQATPPAKEPPPPAPAAPQVPPQFRRESIHPEPPAAPQRPFP